MAEDIAADHRYGQWTLRPGPYLGEISALSLLPCSPLPLLLAGSGSQLLTYDVNSGDLLNSFQVFEGIRVHGISTRTKNVAGEEKVEPLVIAVFGERRVKLLSVRVCDIPSISFDIFLRLPGFDHWVLDAVFLEGGNCLAVGLSDNSVALWDIGRSCVTHIVKSPERCLLYSMRLWGDSVKALRMASGTIYNEIIVWMLNPQLQTSSFMDESLKHGSYVREDKGYPDQQYVVVHLCRLIGHEGSIFRIAWSIDGSKVISVSDDRSARIWIVTGEMENYDNQEGIDVPHVSADIALFGHSARIWDCTLTDSIVITVGEDCTFRVWGIEGNLLMMVKEHIGRGVWRCLYDSTRSLLITAGFDSGIKLHKLPTSFDEISVQKVLPKLKEATEVFTVIAPKVQKPQGQMNSKSEYVRCIRFTDQNTLYVATNNAYIYHADMSCHLSIRWTELAHVTHGAPIICMDIMAMESSEESSEMSDFIAVGDGKGNVTVVQVVRGDSPKIRFYYTWPAEKERQLLGVYLCKSLGDSFVFTADPKGFLKLWKLSNVNIENASMEVKVSLVAVFTPCFATRIMCLNASTKGEVLVCGDQRGNLTFFPLAKDMIISCSGGSVNNIHLSNHFKGAHGISTVTSISIDVSDLHQVDIRTTGGDGCICYFNYDTNSRALEFTGMKQVKGIATIQALSTHSISKGDSIRTDYAIGFTSADFIMRNLGNETKTLEIPCGGWHRPYSYYLGAVPEYQSCFAYVKDEAIHVHWIWKPVRESQLFPQVLNMQFHGREIHSLCFISHAEDAGVHEACNLWIATGCEDGTVRLTRYKPLQMRSWQDSKLLGEHVGGSAVRSVFFVSRIHTMGNAENCDIQDRYPSGPSDSEGNHLLLISVGAKQVLTTWLLQNKTSTTLDARSNGEFTEAKGKCISPMDDLSSLSFQWFSSHMPSKFAGGQTNAEKLMTSAENGNRDASSYSPTAEKVDNSENDWRYLAVTAFQVEHSNTRSAVCFVVVACSDATLTLRALLLPYRLWFDVAMLAPQNSPVLSLQHVAIPFYANPGDTIHIHEVHVVVSGSTDGTITFWDLSETVRDFMQFVAEFQPEMHVDYQRRPRTGRGSQGGRSWAIQRHSSQKKGKGGSSTANGGTVENKDQVSPKVSSTQENNYTCNQGSSSRNTSSTEFLKSERSSELSCEIREIHPLHVNNVHQSGVNCLHISELKHPCAESGTTYCVLSGGDDQALHLLAFALVLQAANDNPTSAKCNNSTRNMWNGPSSILKRCSSSISKYDVRIIYQEKVESAHSSAVKGVWTDGCWAFSTGLDQRVRCWQLSNKYKLKEHSHVIVCVPEPEALEARACGRSIYQIGVAGRGMQMVEFHVSDNPY